MGGLSKVITDPDIIASYNQDALGLKGNFEGVLRPASEEELVEMVQEAFSKGIALTPQGQRTSLTGASICEKGLALSLEKMDRIVDLDLKSQIVLVEPGLITGVLKKELERQGLLYPPDPTSQEECTIGGNVATNASGAKSLRYGPTHNWVAWVRFVDGKGEVHEVRALEAQKASCGPRAFQRALDFLVGSEGIFGVITKVALRFVPAPSGSLILIVYFKDIYQALDFVVDSISKSNRIPSAMELMDETCLEIIKDMEGYYAPKGASALLTIEEEFWEEIQEEDILGAWFEIIKEHTDLSEKTVVLRTQKERRTFQRLRHRVPEALNEESNEAVKEGGIKISTDWAVPIKNIKYMFKYFDELKPLLGDMRVARYGHIGNGHPHFNFIAKNPKEREVAEEVEWLLVKKAVELGGVVSAEHGIGKLKKRHLQLMYPSHIIDILQAIKSQLDPKGILAPGNIL